MGLLRFIKILDSQIARLECAGKSNDYRLHRHRPDHINPRGGAWRDDHPENIQAFHWWCNREKDRAGGDLWPVLYIPQAPWPDRS